MSKAFGLSLVFLAILNSCLPPNTSNVIISTNESTIYADYYAYVFNGLDYDVYWPELKFINSSNSDATISFKYSFFVCGVRQSNVGLNKSVSHFAPKGSSYWEMSENDSLFIRSTDTCGGALIDVNDVDFEWTILAVSAS